MRRVECRHTDFARLDVVVIDRFFRLNVCFPNDGLREICAFVLSCIMRTYGREQDEIWKKQFCRVLSPMTYNHGQKSLGK